MAIRGGGAQMNLRQMDLNLLVALDALLTERSVTRAGRRLHLSQSAMSGMLSRLRHAFRDELLVRVGRSFEPTPFAQSITDAVGDCVRQIEYLLNSRIEFDPRTEVRTFTIAASDYAASLLVAPLLIRLESFGSSISVSFSVIDLEEVDRVARGEIDFAIAPPPVPAPEDTPFLDFPSCDLFTDRWICAVSSDHPTIDHTITEEQFLAASHVTYHPSGSKYGSMPDIYLEHLGITRKVAAMTESLALAPFLIRGTKSISVIPERVGKLMQTTYGGIKLIEPPFPFPPLVEKMFWSALYDSSEPHQWLREQLVDIARSL